MSDRFSMISPFELEAPLSPSEARTASVKVARAELLEKAVRATTASFSAYVNAGGPSEVNERLAYAEDDIKALVKTYLEPTSVVMGQVRTAIKAVSVKSAAVDWSASKGNFRADVSFDSSNRLYWIEVFQGSSSFLNSGPYDDLSDATSAAQEFLETDLVDSSLFGEEIINDAQGDFEYTNHWAAIKSSEVLWNYDSYNDNSDTETVIDGTTYWVEYWVETSNEGGWIFGKGEDVLGEASSKDDAMKQVEQRFASVKSSAWNENPFAKNDTQVDENSDNSNDENQALQLDWQTVSDDQGEYLTAQTDDGNIIDIYPYEGGFLWQLYDPQDNSGALIDTGKSDTVESAQSDSENATTSSNQDENSDNVDQNSDSSSENENPFAKKTALTNEQWESLGISMTPEAVEDRERESKDRHDHQMAYQKALADGMTREDAYEVFFRNPDPSYWRTSNVEDVEILNSSPTHHTERVDCGADEENPGSYFPWSKKSSVKTSTPTYDLDNGYWLEYNEEENYFRLFDADDQLVTEGEAESLDSAMRRVRHC